MALFNFLSRRSRHAALEVDAPALDTRAVVEGEGHADGYASVNGTACEPDWWAILGGIAGPPSLAGPEVSPLSALNVSAVRAAVDLISGIMGTLPVAIYREAGGGGQEVADDHPGQFLVEGDANPWTSAAELRMRVTADALLWGRGYAAIVRDNEGNPAELHRLLPWAVVTTMDPATQEPTYRYNVGETAVAYGYADVIALTPILRRDITGSIGPLLGVAPISSARNAIGLAQALEDHAGRLMRSGARPSGVLSFNSKLGSEVAKRIKASWQAATSGNAAGGTAVLEEGGKFQPLAFTSVDAQFAETRTFQVLEVSRAFGVPPPFLADHGRATWSNFEQSNRQLVTFCLRPWARMWEAAFNRVLLKPEERKAGLYSAFDFNDLLTGDLTARSAAYSNLIASRVMNPNEARARENLPSYPEGNTFANPNTTPAAPKIDKVVDDGEGGEGN